MLVRDLMDRKVLSVSPETSLPEAYSYMLQNEALGVCVVTDDGQIAGVVSEGDMIRATIPSAADIAIYENIIIDKKLPEEMVRALRFTKVEDIMTSNIVTIDADEPILNALALMHVHGLKRLPVMDKGELVGTISRADLLKNLLLEKRIPESI